MMILRQSLRALCGLLLLATCAAHAQTRAWIDRDPVSVGETTTLNIETSEADVAPPDYAPLQRDFEVTGNTSSRQVEVVNGDVRTRTLFAAALQPRREGLLSIPQLKIGNATTQALSLTVTAARVSRAGGAVFIETDIEDQAPYVQQAVGFTLRLFYSADTPVVSGELTQDAPDGAALQRVGSDRQYSDLVGGKRYTVVERRFLLTPERSGPLTIPGARFEGRGVGGFFDDMFGDGQRELGANGAPRFVTVRPVPANAPQPWLPLRGLTMRYLATPQNARAGQAATVEIELRAAGATGPQLPDLQLPAVDGAQVFADAPKIDESFDSGRPEARLTRKFSIVPSRSGGLRMPGPRLQWWDTRAAAARIASLPDINLQVAPGVASAANPAQPVAGLALGPLDTAGGGRASGFGDRTRWWAVAAAVFAVLWLVTLLWALQRRGAGFVRRQRLPAAAPARADTTAPAAGVRDLKRAVDAGDLGDVASVLCAMAMPPARDLDTLQARLDDPGQRNAVAQLQRARWGDGDAGEARKVLRAAFAAGPRWIADGRASNESPLPPLYPPG